MTFSESVKLKKLITSIIVFLVIGVIALVPRGYLINKTQEKITNAESLVDLDSQISTVNTEYESVEKSIEAAGKTFLNLEEDKNTYVEAVGKLCDANGLNIHKMTVNDVSVYDNGLQSMTMNLELQGDLSHIRSVLSDIESSEMLCKINSISYRLSDNTFSWMWRSIDDESVVNWWDISSVSDYLIEDPDDTSSDDDLDLLDANAFMKQGEALCYMEITVIGIAK